MTELELYKFITDANVEWHRENNEGKDDIIIMPYVFNLKDFCELVKNYDDDGEGLQMRLMSGSYVAIWMKELCDYFGVEMNNVFKGKSYDE